MYNQALKLIKKYDTIIIHRHTSPDGDAIGSQVGLKHVILANFPNKTVYIVGDLTKRYAFVEDWEPNEIADQTYNGALAIVLDSGAPHLVSDERYTLAEATLRFDHHLFVEKFCDVEIVDTSFESCCGLIAHFAKHCNLTMDSIGAKALYTGMVTDSGRFRYDSVNSQTFECASYLMQYPFDTNDIYANLYADDFANIQLRAKFTLKIQFSPKNVAYIYTTHQELLESGADEFAVSRGMVGTMSDIRGVNIWVNFTETDRGVLCELRSNKYNINPIAVKYGGGGHQKASGACVENYDVAMQMLADLDAMMEQPSPSVLRLPFLASTACFDALATNSSQDCLLYALRPQSERLQCSLFALVLPQNGSRLQGFPSEKHTNFAPRVAKKPLV